MKIKNATRQGWIDCLVGGVLDISFPESKTRRGRVIENGQISPTLDTGCEVGVVMSYKNTNQGVYCDEDGNLCRIRKLTPRECFRLQGWSDDYFEKAEFVNIDSHLYKQAGNGVTVNVIYEIAKRLPL